MDNFDVNKIWVRPIPRDLAKVLVARHHYMKTFPSGAKLFMGVMYRGNDQAQGVAVFGKSSGTDAKVKLFPNVKPENIIEMQRLWISDDLGHNAESKTLSLIVDQFKIHAPQVKVIWTYAGGCKDDCGFIYQASGFMFLGSETCNDFYLTNKGEYKNTINIARFGKAKHLKTMEERACYLYGEGHMVEAHRHYYFYPIEKGIRRRMQGKVKPFPKQSARYRKGQQWVKNGVGEGHNQAGLPT